MSANLTAEQRAALDVLPAKRRTFVLAYVGEAQGNATEAARTAGYAHPGEEGYRLLKIAHVAEAVDALRVPSEARQIATMDELRELWTKWARDGAMEAKIGDGEPITVPLEPKDRIKAGELLAKSLGGFVERRELSGPGGGPVEQNVRVAIMPLEVARQVAQDGPMRHSVALPAEGETDGDE